MGFTHAQIQIPRHNEVGRTQALRGTPDGKRVESVMK